MSEKKSVVNLSNKSVYGWALYDWANSAFATTIMAGFFPIFFKTYCSEGVSVTVSTARLGLANSTGTLIICLLAPLLGAIADAGAYKKKFLAFFTFTGAVATACLTSLKPGDWSMAIFIYGTAAVSFAACLCFYDSLLPEVATPKTVDRVSALGFALGYIGGGLLFSLNVWMFHDPARFGLADPLSAVKASFGTVSAWWLLFTLPLLLWVREKTPATSGSFTTHIKTGLKELGHTIRHLRQLKTLLLFLAAFFLYNDAVGTTMKMAVDYGVAIGFAPNRLVLALLMVQFIAFPSTLLFGKFAHHFQAKTCIYACIGVYILGLLWASRMHASWEFFVLAAFVGSVQGGIQAISRSFFTRLIPEGKAGEFFGFYNLVGKFSGLAGPTVVGLVGYWSGEPRYGILSIIVFFVAGALVLTRVPEETSDKSNDPK